MVKKLIDLSIQTIKKLQKLADKDRRKVKPYIEKVLEDHANQKTKEV